MADKPTFDIDTAEDFDDGTLATSYLDRDNEYSASDSDSQRVAESSLTSSRALRNKNKRSKADGKANALRASALRVKNWNAKEFESAEYAGKVVKRKEISYAQEDGPQQAEKDGFSSPDEDAMEQWSDAEPFAASDSEEEQAEASKERKTKQQEHEEEEEEADETEDEDVDQEDDEDEEDDDEEEDAEKLIRGFQQEDSTTKLLSTKDSKKFYEKSVHVRHQKLVWEKCLELQIFTKRFLTSCKSFTDSAAANRNADAQEKNQVLDQLYECIQDISDVQNKLCNLPSLTKPPSSTELGSKKRKRDDPQALWQVLQAADAHALPQYNDILNEIMRQNAFTTAQTKKFKAVNQDVLSQVDAVLADKERVKRKAHAPLAEANLLAGVTSSSTQEPQNHDEDALDELMYDDTDFYQQLLKEFIESGAHGDQFSLSMLRKKKKKNVNRKASKGRQIRYIVHPKLENFMFPDPYPKPDMDVDELFRSVFGGQTRQQ